MMRQIPIEIIISDMIKKQRKEKESEREQIQLPIPEPPPGYEDCAGSQDDVEEEKRGVVIIDIFGDEESL
jgi:hypothetical protein